MTKVKYLVLALAACIAGLGHAQTSEVKAATARIVFYRSSTLFGAAIACPIRYKGQEVVELGRGRKATLTVSPGNYVFSNGTSGTEVRVADGETAYIRCVINPGAFVGQTNFIQVSAEEFGRKVRGLKRRRTEVFFIS